MSKKILVYGVDVKNLPNDKREAYLDIAKEHLVKQLGKTKMTVLVIPTDCTYINILS